MFQSIEDWGDEEDLYLCPYYTTTYFICIFFATSISGTSYEEQPIDQVIFTHLDEQERATYYK